jgi:hypothetical protein
MDLSTSGITVRRPGMAQEQIRIERKSLASKGTARIREEAPIDLRTPSGRKLPY